MSKSKLTDHEKNIQSMLEDGLSTSQVARELGISRSSVRTVRSAIERKTGRDPAITPEGMKLKRKSTLADGEGNVKLGWTIIDEDRSAMMAKVEGWLNGLKEEVKPLKPIRTKRTKLNDDLLNMYVLTDAHVGMLAWAEETGDNWDLAIAEQTIVQAFRDLIDRAPAAHTGYFMQLGDMAHYDSHLAVTPQNKHILDADGRPTKLIRTLVRVSRAVIEMLAEKYKEVIVLHAEGNHDIIFSVWLRETMAILYEKSKHIKVLTTPSPYYAVQWGEVMLGAHHGHKARGGRISEAIIADNREMYGNTKHLYIHTGHLHHQKVEENGYGVTEQHQTLAAKDAHAAHGGYRAGRSMQVITYHKKHGEVGRMRYVPGM